MIVGLEVTLGYDTLIIFLGLIFFSFAYYSPTNTRGEQILKVILFYFDSFIFGVAGLVYIGDYVELGTVLILSAVFASFAGLAYTLDLRN